MLEVADLGLSLLHSAVVFFNLFGWISPRTRPWQQILLALTTASWLGLGYFFGLGYCVLTDWQWQIKRQLGDTELPHSFIQFALTRWFGLSLSDGLVDAATGGAFAALLLIAMGQLLAKRRLRAP